MINLTISRRLNFILVSGYAIVLLLMALALALTIQKTDTVKQHNDSVLSKQMPQMLRLMNFDRQLFESLNSLNEFLITGDNADRLNFSQSLRQLQNWTADSEFNSRLDSATAMQLASLLQAYETKSDEVLVLRNDDQKNYRGIASAAELLNPVHQQFVSLLDTLISNRQDIDENEGSLLGLVEMTKLRNSWLNMIMSLRVYFTTRGNRDFERIYLYQEQNLKDMTALSALKSQMEFDSLFIAQLEELHHQYMQNLPVVLQLYQTDQWRLDTFKTRTEIYPLTTRLRTLIESLLLEQRRMTGNESGLLSRELDKLTTLSITALGISLLVSVVVLLIATRNIRSIVNELDQSHQDAIKRSEMLQQSTYELAESLDKLQTTQTQLIEHEKMAALGNLVAGIAHEINTPLGVGVMASSHIEENVNRLEQQFSAGTIRKSEFTGFISDTREANEIMQVNLRRAADLVRSFKQIAVDQSSEELREFELCSYLREIHNSLMPTFKKTRLQVDIQCAEMIQMTSYPGALAQVITNLMQNSVIHAFAPQQEGHIRIQVWMAEQDMVRILYADNGKGMDSDALAKVFEPFYTTRRGQGGSGLGMHLLYNLVTQKLMGNVKLESQPGKGFRADLTISQSLKPKGSSND